MVIGILAVNGARHQAPAASHGQLVAHQSEEWTNNDGRTEACVSQKPSGDEIDNALAPARSFDQEQPTPHRRDREYRLQLMIVERSVRPHHPGQELLSPFRKRASQDILWDVEGARAGIHWSRL